MISIKKKTKQRTKRRRKIRAKVSGTAKTPRLCVFRSNQHIYAQLIDDEKKKVLATASDAKTKKSSAKTSGGKEKMTKKLASAYATGKLIADKAKELKIESVVFDRGGYKYHGRVKALAQGARDNGLKF